jgi:hypothetical protein
MVRRRRSHFLRRSLRFLRCFRFAFAWSWNHSVSCQRGRTGWPRQRVRSRGTGCRLECP